MSASQSLNVKPGPRPGTYQTEDGRVLEAPEGWALLPPGDAGLTRRLKKAGPSWTIRQRKGRRLMSRGVLAPSMTIDRLTRERAEEKDDPAYQRRLEAGRKKRAVTQAQYVKAFEAEVKAFLAFAPRHSEMASALASAVTAHATPVGSGTVARTKRISVGRRAEAAVIAWMRHHTTAYDHLRIPRVKGKRREVRRKLAEQSRRLLNKYRIDKGVDIEACPLSEALFQDRS